MRHKGLEDLMQDVPTVRSKESHRIGFLEKMRNERMTQLKNLPHGDRAFCVVRRKQVIYHYYKNKACTTRPFCKKKDREKGKLSSLHVSIVLVGKVGSILKLGQSESLGAGAERSCCTARDPV